MLGNSLLVLLSAVGFVMAEEPWEWEGESDLKHPGHYKFTFEKGATGSYADGTMMASFHSHTVSEAVVEALWKAGGAATADDWEAGKLYKVTFDTGAHHTNQEVHIDTAGEYKFYFQHMPSEFGINDASFLTMDVAVKAAAFDPHAGHDHSEPMTDMTTDKPIGLVFGATTIVTLMSVVGIFLIKPLAMAKDRTKKLIDLAANSFAAGCMMATGLYLMIPEAHLMIAAGAESESQAMAKFGSAVLCGYFLGAMIHWISELAFGASHSHVGNSAVAPKEDYIADDAEAPPAPAADGTVVVPVQAVQTEPAAAGKKKWSPVVWSVLFGDFFHNFVDGIAIGVAFSGCSADAGWIVTMSAASHEVSQELADYLVLTQNGMSPCTALIFNLLSGVSCILGGVMAVYIDMAGDTQGGLLAFGAGTYFWIANTECFPKLTEEPVSTKDLGALAAKALPFLLGALVIGLVLIKHEHCAAAGGAHEGHDH